MRFLLSLSFSIMMALPVLAQDGGVSSVSLTSFNAIARGKQVLLSWNTESLDANSVVIERSKNGSDYTSIGNALACKQNIDFMETDFQPFEGLSYYRLRITNESGAVSYSNAVPVKYNESMEPVSPVEETGYVNPKGENNSLLVVVLNSAGEQFYSKVEVESKGNPLECVDPDPLISTGTYTIVGCSDQEYYAHQIHVK